MLQWLGLNDAKSAATLVGCLVFLALLLWAMPHWLNRQAASDFAGQPVRRAAGLVAYVTISPVSQGGGGLFNAVALSFAGHQQYYALPRQSQWDPRYHQNVTVTYQVGRSGRIKIDSVTPGAF